MPLPPQNAEEEEKGGAPRYLVAYCSIMTLLLAFFIILQAFASVQKPGLFYTGQGSFIRALETFGLGGVWDRMGGGVVGAGSGPAYRSSEGRDEPPKLRRIDAEMEDASKAMADLEDLFEVGRPPEGSGWRVSLPTPFSGRAARGELSEEEREFCRRWAGRLKPLLLARGFVIRISAELRAGEGDEAGLTAAALASANRVRRELLDNMGPDLRQAAAGRIYSYCRRRAADGIEQGAEMRLGVDILLTKPYADRIREKEMGTDEAQNNT